MVQKAKNKLLMQRKKKVILVISLLCTVISIGLFLGYGKLQNANKKIILNLAQKQKQEIVSDQSQETGGVVEQNNEQKNTAESQAENPKVNTSNTEITDAAKKDKPNTEEEKTPAEPKNATFKINDRLVSWGFQKSKERKIDTIIIHSSYDAIGEDPYSVSGVIAEYKAYGVSPHYLIGRKGQIYRLVSDQNIAYHAGESQMSDGRTGVNSFSLGVEMLTTKTDKLTQEQYDALKLLIADLKGKYEITTVLGHNQIAPGRKDDPWNFEWSKLK